MTNNIKYLEVSDFHYSPKWGISPCRVLVQCVRLLINNKVDPL